MAAGSLEVAADSTAVAEVTAKKKKAATAMETAFLVVPERAMRL